MTEHDDLIRDARLWPRDGINEGPLINGLADEVERLRAELASRPSLAVRGEEELATGIESGMHRHTPINGLPCVESTSTARALIANGTVQVVPSLAAATREAVRTAVHAGIFQRFPVSVFEAVAYTQDGYDSLLDSITDALLAPGGPVQVADASEGA